MAAPRLRAEVARHLWDAFVEPALLAPLLQLQVRALVLCPAFAAAAQYYIVLNAM